MLSIKNSQTFKYGKPFDPKSVSAIERDEISILGRKFPMLSGWPDSLQFLSSIYDQKCFFGKKYWGLGVCPFPFP